MPQIASDDIDAAHATFCRHMGIDEEKWRSVFEFSLIAGFSILDCTKEKVRWGGDLDISDKGARTIQLLAGPHADTLIKAYKHRRYSPFGRIKFGALKFCHIVGFFASVVVGIFCEMWSNIWDLVN